MQPHSALSLFPNNHAVPLGTLQTPWPPQAPPRGTHQGQGTLPVGLTVPDWFLMSGGNESMS